MNYPQRDLRAPIRLGKIQKHRKRAVAIFSSSPCSTTPSPSHQKPPNRSLEIRKHLTGKIYARLHQLVESAAAHLISAGVKPGDVVSLTFPNTVEFIIRFLAVLRARATAVPLNTAYIFDEFEFYLSESKILITSKDVTSLVFKKLVAPTMFLYMGHPNGRIPRYTHSVFAAFISSGKDPTPDERVLLKEQLVFYYIQRSLEGYPKITPFEGIASGFASLVQHLPDGSPTILFCIHSLVEKPTSLCSSTISRHGNSDLWEGESESYRKLLDLLLRLLSLVDIQVLPSLMKSLAQLIVQLHSDVHGSLLNQMHQQISYSDDVIRKPSLVSWVQDLSYLCSRGVEKERPKRGGENLYDRMTSSISLNRVIARL